MISDAPASQGDSSWSWARRETALGLLRALDRSPVASNTFTRTALFDFVDVLVREGRAPEAMVIALKDVMVQAPALQRLEPLLREQLRAAIVSAGIDRYFISRGEDATLREISARDATGTREESDGPFRRSDDRREEHPRG